MEQAAVILKKGEGRTLKAGGAWIFDNEIDKVEGTPEDGSLVPASTTAAPRSGCA